jgi:hypothetical protein
MGYDKYRAALVPLEKFEARAFLEGPGATQRLCDFILTLAVVHADLKDAHLAFALLTEQCPVGKFERTPSWGEYNGLRIHLERLVSGLLDELFDTIKNAAEAKVLEEAIFLMTLKSIGKSRALSWQSIVAVTLGKKSKSSVAKALAITRNHVAFHYCPEKIGEAYRNHFCGQGKREPLLSRGSCLAETRFYFADAAVEDFVLRDGRTSEARKTLDGSNNLIEIINDVLFHIVTTFVEARGIAFMRFSDDQN